MPRKDIHHELLHVDPSGARRSRFTTEHGPVDCPSFMPVGTRATVKGLTPEQVEATGAQVVLANAFHMSLADRRDIVRREGGLHKVMAWNHTILTDSGGFQVFSLPERTIDEDGVTFKYGKSEETIRLTPEGSMEIQRDLGADIVMAFDECVGLPAERPYVEASAARTTRWARRCLDVPLQSHQYLFGIVQGGVDQDLRLKSLEELAALPFDGFAVGGLSVGEGLDELKKVLGWVGNRLPANTPRYVMGVGMPEDLFACVERGMDMFDCVIPTRFARGGTLFTQVGRIRVNDKRYRKDKYPPDTSCSCYTCQRYSRQVMRHLFYAGEPLYETLASIHNIHFYQDLMAGMRDAIEQDRFLRFKDEWLTRYQGEETRGRRK